jgi:hypothetical protein
VQVLDRFGALAKRELHLVSLCNGASWSTLYPPSPPPGAPWTTARWRATSFSELLDICRCSEEFCQFMIAKMQDAVAPEPLSSVRENAFR